MPNVTGYILAGVVVGPFALNLVPQNLVDGMGFLTDVALSFIAFGVGRYRGWTGCAAGTAGGLSSR